MYFQEDIAFTNENSTNKETVKIEIESSATENTETAGIYFVFFSKYFK